MGVNMFRSSSDFSVVKKEPNYRNYKIKNIGYFNGYTMLFLNYPEYINFDGNKILVYKGNRLTQARKSTEIDPHFSELNHKVSPIARFEPTLDGVVMALKAMGVKKDLEKIAEIFLGIEK